MKVLIVLLVFAAFVSLWGFIQFNEARAQGSTCSGTNCGCPCNYRSDCVGLCNSSCVDIHGNTHLCCEWCARP